MIENKTGIVILSRFSSSRLPGKALLKIKGKPVLSYIIEKVEQVVSNERIIVATSTEASDNAIVEFAEGYGVSCYRGSLENVAKRFYEASRNLECQYACRINGDNIFLDIHVLQQMLEKAQTGEYDFLSNVKDRTFPKGMSVEIVNLNYYRKLLPEINANAYYREHVMVYLYDTLEKRRHFYLKNTAMPDAGGLQLALDTPEDFNRASWIIDNIDIPHYQISMRELLKINSNYEQYTQR